MADNFTDAEFAQLRLILQALPEIEREKLKRAFRSGRLISFVIFLDNVLQFFESLGRIGFWINSVLRPILMAAGAIFILYLVATGKMSLSDFK